MLYNATTLASGDESPMNSWPTSENDQNANFAYTQFSEVRVAPDSLAASY